SLSHVLEIIKDSMKEREEAKLVFQMKEKAVDLGMSLARLKMPFLDESMIPALDDFIKQRTRISERPARRKSGALDDALFELLDKREMTPEEICEELDLKWENYRSYVSKLFFKSGRLGRRYHKLNTSFTYSYATLDWYKRQPESSTKLIVELPEEARAKLQNRQLKKGELK
nr:hypothetical protein [Bacteroidia bacterium]